nr:MAG: hypothetical protein [Caudoviricetes sp.]
MEINKLTARLQEQGVETEQLSDSDIYISGNLDIDDLEEVFASLDGYKIEFVKEEPITYN